MVERWCVCVCCGVGGETSGPCRSHAMLTHSHTDTCTGGSHLHCFLSVFHVHLETLKETTGGRIHDLETSTPSSRVTSPVRRPSGRSPSPGLPNDLSENLPAALHARLSDLQSERSRRRSLGQSGEEKRLGGDVDENSAGTPTPSTSSVLMFLGRAQRAASPRSSFLSRTPGGMNDRATPPVPALARSSSPRSGPVRVFVGLRGWSPQAR